MLTPRAIALCLTHTNTLWRLSILVKGGHMEWNINPNKIILNWLSNCTLPSCILVPELPILGTLASDVNNYYTKQAATYNKLSLKDLIEREK